LLLAEEEVVPHRLRGLAHTQRLRILKVLRADGPSTATKLAERLGTNSGALSYHLRQLARHGFINEEPSLGNRRERWWSAAEEAASVALECSPPQTGRGASLPSVSWTVQLTPAGARLVLEGLTALVESADPSDATDASAFVIELSGYPADVRLPE
jgi:DNA-binding MarR family transcriptional regulator